jgi:hypothetical protein
VGSGFLGMGSSGRRLAAGHGHEKYYRTCDAFLRQLPWVSA